MSSQLSRWSSIKARLFVASSCRLPCCLAGMPGDAEHSVVIPFASTCPIMLFTKWHTLLYSYCPLYYRPDRMIALLWHLAREVLLRSAGKSVGRFVLCAPKSSRARTCKKAAGRMSSDSSGINESSNGISWLCLSCLGIGYSQHVLYYVPSSATDCLNLRLPEERCNQKCTFWQPVSLASIPILL